MESGFQKPSQLIVRHFAGLQPYAPMHEAMLNFTDGRTDSTPDEIWVLQHESVFTQGQAGKAEHLLNPGNIPVVQSDRGGQVTYHGPGQWVLYFLLDIRRMKMGARALVDWVEQGTVTALQQLNLEAYAKADAPGVYVEMDSGLEAKIASLGLRIRRGKSFHGVALNVDMDLMPFHRINPCGYAGMTMTQLSDLLSPVPNMDQVADTLLNALLDAIPTMPETIQVQHHSAPDALQSLSA